MTLAEHPCPVESSNENSTRTYAGSSRAKRRSSYLLLYTALAWGALPITQAAAQSTNAYYDLAQPILTQAALPQSPDQILRSGVDRLTGFLIGSGNPTPQSLLMFLNHEIAPYFDFPYMAKWAAGPLHSRLNAEQKERFAALLQQTFLSSLAKNLGSFSRPLPPVEVYPTRPGTNAREAQVTVRVLLDSGVPAQLEFRFYRSESGWKVFDVAANGASAVAFYRTYYGNLFRRYGPQAVLRQ